MLNIDDGDKEDIDSRIQIKSSLSLSSIYISKDKA